MQRFVKESGHDRHARIVPAPAGNRDIRKERRRLLVITFTLLSLTTMIVMLVVTYQLYQVRMVDEQQRLTGMVESWESLIEAVATYDRTHEVTGAMGAKDSTLSQIINAQLDFRGFDQTGEYLLVHRQGDIVTSLIPTRHADGRVTIHIDDSARGEPSRQAVSGWEGILVARDYRGIEVMAATRFMPELDWGLVAKIDRTEITDPFIRSAATAAGVSVALILIGCLVIMTAVKPIWNRLDQNTADILEANAKLSRETAERKLAQEELQQINQELEARVQRRTAQLQAKHDELSLLESVIGQSDVLAYLVRIDGTPVVEYISPNISRFGIEPEQAHCFETLVDSLVVPDDREMIHSDLAALMNQDVESTSRDIRLTLPNGDIRWHRYFNSVITDVSGTPLYIRGTASDITELKRSNDSRLEAEGLFRTLIENAGEAILVTQNNRIVFCNDRLPEITGYSIDELYQKPMGGFIHEADRGMVLTNHRTRIAGGSVPSRYEFRLLHSDGSVRWVEVSAARMEWKGTPAALVFLADVSDRHAHQEKRMLLSAAVEASAESILVTDPDGHIEYVNPAYERVSGYRFEEIKGQIASFSKSELDDETMYDDLWHTIQAGRIWTGRFRNVRKDGSMMIEDATIAPVTNDQGEITHYVTVKRDITDETRLHQQLQQSQKLEALGLLAGGVAHDFNNMLTAIVGYANLIRYRLPDNDAMIEDVDEILRTSDRAATLTRQLLAYGRKQVVRPVEFDVRDVITNMAGMLNRVLTERIILQTDFSDNNLIVNMDPGQLEVVVLNLVVNARDAMPDGGVIRLEARETSISDIQSVESGLLPGTPAVKLACIDTGIGMDESVSSRMFDPFFTTKEQGKGTGLGLSTVYGIIKQAGGHLSVQSVVGEGTAMEILLPRISAAIAPDLTTGESLPHVGGDTGKVVVVIDDERPICDVLSKILTADGHEVHIASSGSEGLKLVSQLKARLDLLITDVVLSDTDGRRVATEARRLMPGLPVVLMSGYVHKDMADELSRDDTTIFLAKPFVPDQLRTAMHSAVHGPATGEPQQ